ncbi:helix-turn-helix transcriptional regulator [Pyrococcus kukulkanii]|uniref:IclR family transcriptional regulator n=1 Tax=Pyrococcus kukulkanii TaxID=1609559 RepID=A0A127BAB5_9EURY|nr:IclR family transcriptional regulator [Pyrococcus kukulkanii]AMM53739.1 IclR family transcriptional regulator [Pyrococcus kukulkanii]
MKRLAIIVLFLLLPQVLAYNVTVKVFSDGYALIKIVRNVSVGENVSVSLPIQDFTNLSVKINGREVSFVFTNNGIVVYPGEPGILEVSYLTPDLTSKEGKVWRVNLPFNETKVVILPQDSVIVGLSGIPLSISGNSVVMPKGEQYIEYIFEHNVATRTVTITVTQSKVNTITTTVVRESDDTSRTSLALFLGLLIGLGVGIIGKKIRLRKLRGITLEELSEKFNLNEDEKAVIMYIADHGGKVRQADIRNELGIPRTTAWRILKRLESFDILKLEKINNETWAVLNIEIKKEE